MATDYEKTIKAQTIFRDAEGTEVTVKHYFDGSAMIGQDADKVFIPAGMMDTFVKFITMTRPTRPNFKPVGEINV